MQVVRQLVVEMYCEGDLPPPRRIVLCQSPLATTIAAGLFAGPLQLKTWKKLFTGNIAGPETRNASGTVWNALRVSIDAAMGRSVKHVDLPNMRSVVRRIARRGDARDALWGRTFRSWGVNTTSWAERHVNTVRVVHELFEETKLLGHWDKALNVILTAMYNVSDVHWAALGEFVLTDSYGAKTNDLQPVWAQIKLRQQCGWYAAYDDLCIVTNRPKHMRFDDQGRLHCDHGPAILYQDGWDVHAWHGIQIPRTWMDGKTLTATRALGQTNIEKRRVACEIVGWDNILRQLDAITVDKDANPQIGTLLRVDIPGLTNQWRSGDDLFLRVECGTGRTFAIPVPPGMRTAREANAWTYGIAANDYDPEVRT